MFGFITRFVRYIKITWDYSSYEEKCRDEHNKKAEIEFSVNMLENNLDSIEKEIDKQANNIFFEKINSAKNKIYLLNHEINTNESLYSLLTRNYKKELEEASTKKSALYLEKKERITEIQAFKTDLSAAYDGKSAAYDEVNHYKSEIDWWYEKSERASWRFGNKGKKIPNRSFFGQSHGDLAHYKRKRDEAWGLVGEWEADISSLKNKKALAINRIEVIKAEIEDTKKAIAQINADQTQKYKLKAEGVRTEPIRIKLIELKSELDSTQRELSEFQSARCQFVAAKTKEYDVAGIKAKIQDILDRKTEFLQSFDLEANKALRRDVHRAEWLKERGLA